MAHLLNGGCALSHKEKTMKVKYEGTKKEIHIFVPVGINRRSFNLKTVKFIKGEPIELEDDDATKLCKLDKNFVLVLDTKKATKNTQAPKVQEDIQKKLEGN